MEQCCETNKLNKNAARITGPSENHTSRSKIIRTLWRFRSVYARGNLDAMFSLAEHNDVWYISLCLCLCQSVNQPKIALLPLRPVHTRELVPGTRSRNTLPGKYPNQYTRRTRRGSWMMKQPDWGMGTKKYNNLIGQQETRHFTASKYHYTRGSLLLKQTRATYLPLELAPSYQTSLIWGSKTREQKFCCATYIFAANRWCRRGTFAPGACCRSVLREQAPSCVPAFILRWMPAGVESINHETIDFMSRTTALHVRYKSVYIS